MSKTPEQMAEEYCEDHDECEFARDAFLAGYQAAKDEYKVAIDTYNDVAKQMLEEAVRIMSPQDRLADADKVMNSSNNSNGWISVKERLPEYDVEVLTFETGNYKVNAVSEYTQWWWDSNEGFERNPTHWMPLPKVPKGE
jgi:hypothetical protein